MTDEATTETISDETAEVDGPRQLRDALKRSQANEARLTKQLMGSAYTEAGLDTESGLGKAIAKEYKGEPTSEGILEYALEEYGYTPTATPDNEHAAKIVDETKKLDGVQTVSTSTVPLPEGDALRQASKDGDLRTAGAIKAAQLRRKLQ